MNAETSPAWPDAGRELHVVVDGDNLSHRVFHASGRNRNDAAFLGLVRRCIDHIVATAGQDVTHVTVAFDSSDNVRRETWPHYKASRSERDSDLDAQMTSCQQALAAAGLPTVCVQGWEADDVVASHIATHPDADVVVISSDRDLLALVSERVRLLRLTGAVSAAPLLGPDEVHEIYGVQPSQYRDLAALRGDTSDDLPGVAGIGAKTAAALLAALGSVEAALADPDAARDAIGARARHLVAGEDTWRHNVEVMRLRDELDVPPAPAVAQAQAPVGHPLEAALADLLDACTTGGGELLLF